MMEVFRRYDLTPALAILLVIALAVTGLVGYQFGFASVGGKIAGWTTVAIATAFALAKACPDD